MSSLSPSSYVPYTPFIPGRIECSRNLIHTETDPDINPCAMYYSDEDRSRLWKKALCSVTPTTFSVAKGLFVGGTIMWCPEKGVYRFASAHMQIDNEYLIRHRPPITSPWRNIVNMNDGIELAFCADTSNVDSGLLKDTFYMRYETYEMICNRFPVEILDIPECLPNERGCNILVRVRANIPLP